jgi:hypothetical protein
VTASRWSPLDIAPDLWLDASDASTITDAGGGAVSEWRDKSGHGVPFGMGIPSWRPITGTRTQNGLNVIDFVRASGHYLTAGDNLDLGLTSGLSIFAVAKFDDLGAGGVGSTVFGKSNTTAVAGRYGIIRLNSQTYGAYSWGNSASGTAIVNDTSLATRVLTQITKRITPPTSSWTVLRADGVQIGTSGLFTDVASPWDTSFALTVGRYGNSLPALLDGFVAEVIFVRRAVTDAERDATEAYLKAKWGTS